MQVPRIIEMQSRPGNIPGLEVTPNTRRPPAIFQVNKEVRAEAMKVYMLRVFDTLESGPVSRILYYNPEHDIIYFSVVPNTATMWSNIEGHLHRGTIESQSRHIWNRGYRPGDWYATRRLQWFGSYQRKSKRKVIKRMRRIQADQDNNQQLDGQSGDQSSIVTPTIPSPSYHFVTLHLHHNIFGQSFESIAFKDPDIRFFNSFGSGSHPDIKAVENRTGCTIKFRVFHQAYNHPSASRTLEEVGFIGLESGIAEAREVVMALVEEAGAGELVKVTEIADNKEEV
ncbi:uncharacterized protein PAC_04610 [Phialocephala subalpina]|uniref:2EXR domain-containing protein n=1 Tax=Phialocephala subalpina TaxID=576137 RepID=A0A1L7WPN3_9HELO|nr:uncharacterized protein PAC_04610 [Phialocephala subalpina]